MFLWEFLKYLAQECLGGSADSMSAFSSGHPRVLGWGPALDSLLEGGLLLPLSLPPTHDFSFSHSFSNKYINSLKKIKYLAQNILCSHLLGSVWRTYCSVKVTVGALIKHHLCLAPHEHPWIWGHFHALGSEWAPCRESLHKMGRNMQVHSLPQMETGGLC